MGLKTLLFGDRSSASSTSSVRGGHRNLKAHGYDSAVALEAPVRGSYPVAGNGPNVLDEIQRVRAKKDVARKSTNLAREPSTHKSTAEAPPDIVRWRENIAERPQTAPHNGSPGGGQEARFTALVATGTTGDGRTRSESTTKSPPFSVTKARRNSLHSFAREVGPAPLPSAPPRDIKTYQPRKATDNHVSIPASTDFQPPYAQHQRSDSRMSHKSYVDLLDAHSNIRPSQEATRHRAKASGMRNYGEDVADRNIVDFGSGSVSAIRAVSKAFDVNTPEFSYLKSLYSSTASPATSTTTSTTAATRSTNNTVQAQPTGTISSHGSGTQSAVHGMGQVTAAAAKAADYVLDPLPLHPQAQPHALSSDDISLPPPVSISSKPTPSRPTLRSRAATESTRSGTHHASPPASAFASGPPRSRPAAPASLRSDTSSVRSFSYNTVNTSRSRDDVSTVSNGTSNGHRVRALSPLSASTGSVYEDGLDDGPAPPIPARGRNRVARQYPPPGAEAAQLPSPIKISNPIPVSITSSNSKPALTVDTKGSGQPVVAVAPTTTATPKVREVRKATSVSFSDAPPQSILPAKYPPPSLKDRKRTMSAEGSSSPTLGQRPMNGSVSYSPYHSPARGSPHGSIDSTTRSYTATKRKELVVEGAKEPPSLKGIVNLSNTVDTVVTTKKLPAVVHEHVTPTQHEIREERITREIHYHDVYHRTLPVIETIILPTKHYIHSPDGKFLIEIPEHDVPIYTGRPLESVSQGWKLVRVTDPPSPVKTALPGQTQSSSPQRKPLPSTTNSQQLIEQFQSYGPYIRRASGEEAVSDSIPDTTITSTPNRGQSVSASLQVPESSTSGQKPEPILTSKKTYMTEEGYPRTEYHWRHPPVFEDSLGRTQPIYMSGIVEESSPSRQIRSSSDEEDANGVNFGSIDAKGEMFRDSGYGEYTALPGLTKTPAAANLVRSSNGGSSVQNKGMSESSPVPVSGQMPIRSILKNSQGDRASAKTSAPVMNTPTGVLTHSPVPPSTSGHMIVDDEPGEKIQLGRVLDDDRQPRSSEAGKIGEATSFLRRLKEKRRASGDSSLFRAWSKGKGKNYRHSADVGELLKGAKGLNTSQ